MEKKLRVVACVVLALSFAAPLWPGLSLSADRIKLALPAKSMGYLPLFVAVHRGFFKDEGIDIEIPMMLPQLAHSALFAGEIDYHGVADSWRLKERPLGLSFSAPPARTIF